MRWRVLSTAAVLVLCLGVRCPPQLGGNVAVLERFEAELPIPVDPTLNPFDPGAVSVVVEFHAPDGTRSQTPAFVYQGYRQEQLPDGRERLTADGPRVWRVRYTPTRSGIWAWRWRETTVDGTRMGPWKPLLVRPNRDPDRHGFVRRSPHDDRYLAFDDGTPFVPIGENLAWYDGRGTFAYEDWMAKLAASGATYVRLWMPSWAMGLVYPPATLADWSARLDRAWQLDRVIRLAEKHGLYVMLSVQNHGPFDLDGFFGSGWGANLYNAELGGPLSHPSEFFTDPTAREIFRRYLRYVVARWGDSPHVMAFELWNEVDLTEQPPTVDPVVDWHREMAGVLREHDPNDRLITTSTTDELMVFTAWLGNFPIEEFPLALAPVWELPEIDFVQIHAYQIAGLTLKLPIHTLYPRLVERMRAFGKPVLIAEAGVDFRGAVETMGADPEGEGFHDLIWAGLFSGGFGTGMSWWWDHIVDVEDWYFHFAPVARIVEGVDFPREGFERTVVPVDAPGSDVVAHVLAGDQHVLAWVKNAGHEFYAPDRRVVDGAQLALPALPAGAWQAYWIDPWTGAETEPEALLGGEPVVLDLPDFSRDTALRLERVAIPE